MSTRRTKPGGWVEAAARPVPLVRRGEVPRGRFTFLRRGLRARMEAAHRPGLSARAGLRARPRRLRACGVDTEALRKDKRKLDYAARRQFEKDWGWRRHLWDADHIVPVAEGGGECDLSNMRTLCLQCHRAATAALRRRLGGQACRAD